MARTTPKVQTKIAGENADHPIIVGSPEWFGWLEKISVFAFETEDGTGSFTARLEQRQGSRYWYAYRRKHGKLRSAYLGRAEELTLARLNEVARNLEAPLPTTSQPASTEEKPAASVGSINRSPLLATKLFIPRARPNLVARPRLTDYLKQAELCPLTVIVAPAGFGKTTLLSDWIARCGLPVGWVSLDENDNDPTRFLTYLIAALQKLWPGLDKSRLDLLQSPQGPDVQTALTELVNAISSSSLPDFALVLDDYHMIEAEAVHNALTFLLEYLPPAMHLIITSRADPPLPLARLRARGQLVELRATDLRFRPDEVAALLDQTIGLGLSAETVAALEERTEGWAAGLQLAALSLQGQADTASFVRAFTGSHRFVLDYLAEEVLRRQPESVQNFLLQTSLLERLSGPLCKAVTGRADSQKMLERLEQANLFLIPLDDERRWYRYHHLFAEFLRSRQNGSTAELHQRASQWFEENGLLTEAVGHALAAADFDRAASFVEQAAQTMLMQGEISTLLKWIETLPEEIIRSRPRLYTYLAWALVVSGRLSEAEQRLIQAELSLGGTANQSAEIAAIRSIVAAFHLDIPSLLALSTQALEGIAEDNLFLRSIISWSSSFPHIITGDLKAAIRAFEEADQIARQAGNLLISLSSRCQIAELYMIEGQLKLSVSLYREAQQLNRPSPTGQLLPTAGMAYMGLGEVLREWNELVEAERYLLEGIELCQHWGDMITFDGWVSLARVKWAQGDTDGAFEKLDNIKDILSKVGLTTLATMLSVHQVRFWLGLGKLEPVISWIEETQNVLQNTSDTELIYPLWPQYTTLARALIAQGQYAQATAWLERLLERAVSKGWWGSVLEIRIIQALSYQAQGKTLEAFAELEAALTQAEPEGYVRIFADEGHSMDELLKSYQQSVADKPSFKLNSYINKLRAAIRPENLPPLKSDFQAPPEAGRPTPQAPFSERELKVLRLIAAGLSNPAIARELFVEVSTIKTHLLHIYSKLNVHSRVQAVERARELSLL